MSDDSTSVISRLSIPIVVLTTIIGGSAWLTTTRNRVEQVSTELQELKAEYRAQKDKIVNRLEQQDDKLSQANAKLSALDAKMDIMINAIRKRRGEQE